MRTNAFVPVLLALVATACSGAAGPASPSSSAAGAGTKATYLLANSAGLLALDDSCHPIGRVVELPNQSAAATPSLSTDRTRIGVGSQFERRLVDEHGRIFGHAPSLQSANLGVPPT